MQRLDRADDIVGTVLRDGGVELADGGDAEDPAPGDVLLVDADKVRLGVERCHLAGVILGGQAQHEAGRVGGQSETIEAPGAMHERLMPHVEVGAAFHQIDLRRIAVFEQMELVVLSGARQVVDRLPVGEGDALDRQIGVGEFAHARLDARDGVGRVAAVCGPLDVAKEPAADRVPDAEERCGKGLLEGHAKQEGERPAVDAPAMRVRQRQGNQVAVDAYRMGQGHDFVVQQCGEHGQAVAGQAWDDFGNRRTGGERARLVPVHGYANHTHAGSFRQLARVARRSARWRRGSVGPGSPASASRASVVWRST